MKYLEKILSNNKSNFDLKKSSLHSVLLVHSLKPPLWSFLNWLYRGLSDKTALKWEKENNFKWGITWLYIAAAVIFSGITFFLIFLHVVTLQQTRKSPFFESKLYYAKNGIMWYTQTQYFKIFFKAFFWVFSDIVTKT